jgi:uridine kinase
VTDRPTGAIDEVVARVLALRRAHDRRITIGVSGYGGAGKSTIARRLEALLPQSYRLRGDDFLDPARSHLRSRDWNGFERERLVDTVLRPFRDGRPCTFRRFDWSAGYLGPSEKLPETPIMIVDAVGLFHPITQPFIDLAVWVDVDAATAMARGKQRDRELGRDHDHLWDGVWAPNDADFDECFAPRDRADILVPNRVRVAR